MNKGVIPFLPTSFGSFVGLIFVFSVLGIAIRNVYWQDVVSSAGQMNWKRKLPRPRLEMLGFRSDSLVDRPTSKPLQDEENRPAYSSLLGKVSSDGVTSSTQFPVNTVQRLSD